MKRLELELASSREAAASALANENSEKAQRLEVIKEKIAAERQVQGMDQHLKEIQAQAEADRKRY